MKKIAILFAAAMLLLSSVAANAEGLIIKGGLAYTNASSVAELKNVGLKGFTGWEFGAGYQTETFSGISLQPEVLYKVKGVKINDVENVKFNYLEIPVNIQWGIDLLIAKPFVFAAPFIGFGLNTKFSKADTINETIAENFNKFEYGLGLGIGVEFARFQLTGKYNWNFGQITTWDAAVQNVKGLDPAARTLELTLGLKF